MMIIPVIDLMAGQVVRADRGQRAGYRPLSTPLADSSDPSAVLRGLGSLYLFSKVYVADLDAIQGRGDQRAVLQTLVSHFPAYQFWVDAGARSVEITSTIPEHSCPVLGSESHALADVCEGLDRRPDAVLSLDFDAEGFIGDTRLLHASHHWPEDVIVMKLERVGSYAGPDIDCLERVRRCNPHRRYYAAGGIRHDWDLETLMTLGMTGVLVSSALHTGSIKQ